MTVQSSYQSSMVVKSFLNTQEKSWSLKNKFKDNNPSNAILWSQNIDFQKKKQF